MIGTIRWNFMIAIAAMLLTFLFSIVNNVLLTSILRGLYSFLILFILVFFLRWLLGTVAGLKPLLQSELLNDDQTGHYINVTTPDEEQSLNELIKNNMDSHKEDHPFSPLNPPKLLSTDKLNPEELAKALRHLSEE